MTAVEHDRQTPAGNHRWIAEGFTARVRGATPTSWDNASPVPEWRARDVVGHLVDWFAGFLESGAGIVLDRGPSPEEDPVVSWQVHAAAVQALLDDPANGELVLRNPHIGDIALPQAIDRFYTPDVFMHTWDLARATGQDDTLDEELCRQMYEGMLPLDEMLRASGQYGPRVDVGEDAPFQDKLMGFIGRRP